MWMVSPELLCRQHLLGEHSEIHKHRHVFVKGYKIDKRIEPIVQIQPSAMKQRHDELAEEMLRRGYNHRSDYEQPDLSNYPEYQRNAVVDLQTSKTDLISRCKKCKELIQCINTAGRVSTPASITT